MEHTFSKETREKLLASQYFLCGRKYKLEVKLKCLIISVNNSQVVYLTLREASIQISSRL